MTDSPSCTAWPRSDPGCGNGLHFTSTSPGRASSRCPLTDYGMNSIYGVSILGDIEDEFGVEFETIPTGPTQHQSHCQVPGEHARQRPVRPGISCKTLRETRRRYPMVTSQDEIRAGPRRYPRRDRRIHSAGQDSRVTSGDGPSGRHRTRCDHSDRRRCGATWAGLLAGAVACGR